MALTMYAASVPVFTRMLTNLSALLDKAEAYAAERKFDVNVLVSARLAPDMHPLSFQIQSATDSSKFAVARLCGKETPVWADDEKTVDDLKARIRKALDFLATFTIADFEGSDEKQITTKRGGQDVTVTGEQQLFVRAFPNFFFHVTTAYDILRHNGVPLGKRDFLG